MFLALVSPKSEINGQERVPRDVALVIDTSGSMKGEKIEQVKKALRFCLDKLDPKDRFAIVQFSTMAQTFEKEWTEAKGDNLAKARAWIDQIEAGGGTNISEALQRTFALGFEEGRLATVLFLTDGRPTVDLCDTEALVKFVKDSNKRNLRIFTFGVGDDVNTHLLDRMSSDAGGITEYVRPGEAIDGKVTRLFSKMSHPVLTDLALEVPGVQIAEMYPGKLPDLFRGSQVVVVGSYKGSGDSVIRLKGRVGKKREELVYEGTFPKKTAERAFIAPLFANRKIGYLLDQIRLHGENRELRDEVVRLSLAYGIETPYTSYLVLENEQQYKQYGINRSGWDASHMVVGIGGGGTGSGSAATAPRPSMTPVPSAAAGEQMKRAAERIDGTFGDRPRYADESGAETRPARMAGAIPHTESAQPSRDNKVPASGQEPAGKPAAQARGMYYGVRAEADDLRADVGKTAVEIAQQIQRLRGAENAGRGTKGVTTVQQRGGRAFANYRGVWVDQRFEGSERLTKIKWGSEAFFRLVREKPPLREILSLGQRVVVVTARGQAIALDIDEGAEQLTDAQMKELFAAAPAKP
jgi:Ca-activated chloride channel family protein